MTKLQNSTNPTFGVVGSCWTSTGDNSIPDWSGYPAGWPGYGNNGFYPATQPGHSIGDQATLSTFTLTAGSVYYQRFFVMQSQLFEAIAVSLITGVGASNMSFAIYDPNNNLLAGSSSGNVSSAVSSSVISYTFASPLLLTGGKIYVLAFAGSSSSLEITGVGPDIDWAQGGECDSIAGTANGHVLGAIKAQAYTPVFSPTVPVFTGSFTPADIMPLVYLQAYP